MIELRAPRNARKRRNEPGNQEGSPTTDVTDWPPEAGPFKSFLPKKAMQENGHHLSCKPVM
jgi:hypothetical protein